MNYLGEKPARYRLEMHYFLIEYVLIEECPPSPIGIPLGEGGNGGMTEFASESTFEP